MMDIELLQFLLDRDYAVIVGEKPFLTKKFKNLFEPEQIKLEVIKAIPLQVDSKTLWNKFIVDAEIPHRIRAIGSGNEYTIRQFNIPAANRLKSIINNSSINYTKLVESTKNYYKNNNLYRVILSNYLIKDVWKDEYELYEKKGNTVTVQDGSSRWED